MNSSDEPQPTRRPSKRAQEFVASLVELMEDPSLTTSARVLLRHPRLLGRAVRELTRFTAGVARDPEETMLELIQALSEAMDDESLTRLQQIAAETEDRSDQEITELFEHMRARAEELREEVEAATTKAYNAQVLDLLLAVGTAEGEEEARRQVRQRLPMVLQAEFLPALMQLRVIVSQEPDRVPHFDVVCALTLHEVREALSEIEPQEAGRGGASVAFLLADSAEALEVEASRYWSLIDDALFDELDHMARSFEERELPELAEQTRLYGEAVAQMRAGVKLERLWERVVRARTPDQALERICDQAAAAEGWFIRAVETLAEHPEHLAEESAHIEVMLCVLHLLRAAHQGLAAGQSREELLPALKPQAGPLIEVLTALRLAELDDHALEQAARLISLDEVNPLVHFALEELQPGDFSVLDAMDRIAETLEWRDMSREVASVHRRRRALATAWQTLEQGGPHTTVEVALRADLILGFLLTHGIQHALPAVASLVADRRLVQAILKRVDEVRRGSDPATAELLDRFVRELEQLRSEEVASGQPFSRWPGPHRHAMETSHRLFKELALRLESAPPRDLFKVAVGILLLMTSHGLRWIQRNPDGWHLLVEAAEGEVLDLERARDWLQRQCQATDERPHSDRALERITLALIGLCLDDRQLMTNFGYALEESVKAGLEMVLLVYPIAFVLTYRGNFIPSFLGAVPMWRAEEVEDPQLAELLEMCAAIAGLLGGVQIPMDSELEYWYAHLQRDREAARRLEDRLQRVWPLREWVEHMSSPRESKLQCLNT